MTLDRFFRNIHQLTLSARMV